jgi:hypothetical protein
MADLSALETAAQLALAPYIGGDRPTNMPGGCDCQLCGSIFFGSPTDTECAGCAIQENFKRLANPKAVLELIARVRALEEARRDEIVAAFEAGALAVHENYQPDTDPDFKEAAYDYAASLLTKKEER